MKLHQDFPELEDRVDDGRTYWAYDLPDPYSDIEVAFESQHKQKISIYDVVEITNYWISSNAGRFGENECDSVGSELSMHLLGRLNNGTWFTLEAGNDYTGWGCQDFSEVTLHETREDAILNGLTTEARNLLGLAF